MKNSLCSRFIGFAAAGALVFSMTPVAAIAASDADLTADRSIEVSGLDEGDSAQYYQIIEQDLSDSTKTPPYVGTQDWKLTTAVDKYNAAGKEKPDGIVDGTENTDFGHKNADGGSVNGLTVDELVITDKDEQGTKIITKDMMNALAAAVTNNGASGTDMTGAGPDGKVTAKIAAGKLGLYMVVAVPGDNNIDTVYKPIFVSADYDQDAATDKIALVANPNDSGADATDYNNDPKVFKRSKLAVDKKSGARDADGALSGTPKDSQHDVAVGDVVDFTITTNMPTYSSNYTGAVFKLTDVLTTGLELCDASGNLLSAGVDASNITVAIDGYASAKRWTSDTAAADYKVTVNSTGEFVVEFMNDANKGENANTLFDKTSDTDAVKQANDHDGILYTAVGNPKITVTYKAKVTSAAADQVNQMDNTVTLNFSNEPTDTTGAGELTDKTRHYTFDIDANVLGQGSGSGKDKTSEVRKIAVDANGEVIEEATTSELDSVKTEKKFSWLQDAEFELKQISAYVNDDPATSGSFSTLATPAVVKFDSNNVRVATGGSNPKSDADGYIPMKGLDAGVYQLKEISAPLGYSFDPSKVYTITITPTYVLDADDNEILSKYEVKIEFTDAKGTAQESKTTYTAKTDATSDKPISFLNDDGAANTSAGMGVVIDPASETALIVNKKLGILPATGGSGILFYVFIGAAIMAAAVILSKRRRKESANPAAAA